MTDFARNAVRQTVLTLAAITALSAAAFGPARADYPDRQITLIVCFPAGGGTDIAARLINTHLADILGKPVIIENRGGAGGSIGTATAARAAPDGYKDIIDKAGLKIK
jgi:tripartite-type tricarboxylate transporter receptor subunit TctC